ncbi:hypothetical protein ACWKW6_20580 [Dyadobacter jiangsuensis]
MASLFLNQSERERYETVPVEISEYDLMQFFQIKTRLTQILELNGTGGVTFHWWLCQVPTSNTPRVINQTLKKIHFLKSLNVHDWDLSVISLNRRKRLAQIARNVSNKYFVKYRRR